MQNSKILVGKTFTTNQNYKYEVIENLENDMYKIRFLDKNKFETIRSYQSVCKATIKNPFYPTCYGVGYIGCEKTIKWVWKHWSNIIERCYTQNKGVSKTYKECKVTEEWLNYKNFENWALKDKTYKKEYVLDKDILVKGNKLYSPDTCCFVPVRINALFTKRQNKRGKYPIGTSKRNHSKKYRARCYFLNGSINNIGDFDTPEEAFYAYKEAKEQLIKNVADQYKGQISEKVYNAMYNYTVEITD